MWEGPESTPYSERGVDDPYFGKRTAEDREFARPTPEQIDAQIEWMFPTFKSDE